MKSNSSNLKSVGGVVLSAGVNVLLASYTGGLSLPFASIVSGFVESVSANIASAHIGKLSEKGFDSLSKSFNGKESDPEFVNHDLERLFKKSAVIALQYIKTSYLKGYQQERNFLNILKQRVSFKKKTEREILYKQVSAFFDNNIANIENEIVKADKIAVSKIDIKDPNSFLNKITDIIFENIDVILSDSEMDLIRKFYADHLPYCFELAFKESLKHDDIGFKAFQIWILEDMRSQNAQNLRASDEIRAAIRKLEAGGDFLNREEEEKKWDKVAERVFALLEPQLNGLQQEFKKLEAQISKRLDSIDNELKALTIYVKKGFQDTNQNIIESFEKTNTAIDDGFENLINQLTQFKPKTIDHKLSSSLKPEIFIGREGDVKSIRDFFTQDRRNSSIFLISGMGGLGKTSLASYYFHNFNSGYNHIGWIAGKDNFKSGLLALAGKLDLSFENTLPDETKLTLLVNKLENLPKPCLLVIDNIDRINDLKELKKLLGRLSNFHILITTRIKDFEALQFYHLAELKEEEGLELFKSHYKYHVSEDDELFKKIFRSIHGNTKLLELLAKKLNIENGNEETYPLSRLVEDLQAKGVLGLTGNTKVELDIEGTINDIILAMYEISNLNTGQIELLYGLSILPAEGIPFSILKNLFFHIGDVSEHLNQLHQSGWLEKQRENRESVYKISPLIQDIIKKKRNNSLDKNCQLLIDSIANHDELVPPMRYRFCTSIYENLRQEIDELKIDDCDDVQKELFSFFFYQLALDCDNSLKKYEFISRSLFFVKNISTNKSLKKLLSKNDNYKTILPSFKEKLSSEELNRIRGYNKVLLLIAGISFDLEDLNSCEMYYNLSYQIASAFVGNNVYFDYIEYNRYLARAGREIEAETFFFDEYKTNKAAVFSVLNDCELTNPEIRIGNNVYDFAQLDSETKDKIENAFGFSTTAAHELAKLFRKQERFEEAVYFHKKSISLQEVKKDINYEDLAVSMNALACTYLMMEGEDHAKAKDLLSIVYKYYKEKYTEDHSCFGYYYLEQFIAAIRNQDALEVCLEIYNKAKDIFTKNFGAESSNIFRLNVELYDYVKNRSPNLELINGMKAQILEAFASNLSSSINRFGMNNPSLHHGMVLAAQILSDTGRTEEAEELRKKRKEFLRIKTLRTEVRTFDLPTKPIVSIEEKAAIVKLLKPVTSLPVDMNEFEIDLIQLPFYKSYDLCKVKIPTRQSTIYKNILISKDKAVPLGTTTNIIYQLGETDLELNEKSLNYYTTFFFDNVVGRHGKFYVLNDGSEIPWREDETFVNLFKLGLQNAIPSLTLIAKDEKRFVLEGYIIFVNNLYKADIIVDRLTGKLEIINDQKVFIDITHGYFKLINEDSPEYLNRTEDSYILDRIPACIDPIYYIDN